VFNADGTKIYMVGDTDTLYEYLLSIAYDISTASYSSISFNISSQDSQPRALAVNSAGTKMYIVGESTDTIYQYSTVLTTNTLDLSSGSVFEITPTSDIQVSLTNPAASGTSSGATLLLNGAVVPSTAWDISTAVFSLSFSVSAQDTSPKGIFFKPDGTKMYVVGAIGQDVNEYNLSTAWDSSTASYLQNFSVATQEINPEGLFFKPDGTKMYVVGFDGDDINEYNLSAAWDVSTASYSQSFSVASQDSNPRGIFFKPDGLKMYVDGYVGQNINEYNLSTAWDISTASYLQNFSVSAQETAPSDVFFKPDGTKMYVVGFIGDDINEYNLSTAWDISTASYLQNFSVTTQDTSPSNLFFKPDGTKMYVVGASGDDVNEYDLGTPATITYDTSLQWPGGTAPTSPAIGETDILTFNTTDGGTTYKAVVAIDGAS
jgi:6-phosphogluconolactonase (cycloisomerase 2 family)